MITISLCMIVKNEEEVLARCLDSVGRAADEIVIADTGSTDRTKEIARRYTDQVYDFSWIDDFSAARNFAFSKAKSDYILWLDADDVLPEKTREGLILLKEKLPPQTDMVMLPYHTAFDGAGRPVLTYYRERLMRRAYGYRWEGEVHEVIPPAGNVITLPLPVEHRKQKPAESGRNLRIFEKLLKQGKSLSPRQQFYYARELMIAGRDQEAAGWLEHFLEEGKGWREDNIRACLDLAGCLGRLGKRQHALAALFRSFVYSEPRPEACCGAGDLFSGGGEYRRAAYWYQLALSCRQPEESGGFRNPDYDRFIPCMQLCVCYDRLGDHAKAEEYHRQARALKPEDPAVAYNEAYFAGLHAAGAEEKPDAG